MKALFILILMAATAATAQDDIRIRVTVMRGGVGSTNAVQFSAAGAKRVMDALGISGAEAASNLAQRAKAALKEDARGAESVADAVAERAAADARRAQRGELVD